LGRAVDASDLLRQAAGRAAAYLGRVDGRRVAPDEQMQSALSDLAAPLQAEPMDAAAVIELLDRCGSPATVASA